MRVQSAQPTDACAITSVSAVLRSLQILPFFTPKGKFYDNNTTDLSQELIARPQLIRVVVVRIFRRSLQSLSVLRVICKGDVFRLSFDMPSFDMLCKQLKDYLTVKLAILRLLAGQMENKKIGFIN